MDRRHGGEGGVTLEARARAVVNTAGPWVDAVRVNAVGRNSTSRFTLRLVKGSHIIVDRLFEGAHAYIFQNADGRVIFAIPYEHDFTLFGTTDVPFDGDPASVAIDPEEVDYLCAAASEYFRKAVAPSMVRRTYSGVRPLHDDATAKDASAVTRDYVFDIDGDPPILSVYGGKITTYRRLAEHALMKLEPIIGKRGAPWTQAAALPGGDIANIDFMAFRDALASQYSWAPPSMVHRLARAYGTRASKVIDCARSLADLGEEFGGGLTLREVEHLRSVEFARSADDILWRRSKT